MSEGTLIEHRRRVSDRDKRQLTFLMTLSWLLITTSAALVILLADYLRFENAFNKKATAIEHRLQSHIRQNEAVLEGFAAFLSGQKELDDTRASEYASKIRQRFPHVFMLEVAEGVDAEDLPALVSRQRQKGYPEFEVKAFDYKGDRQWRPLPGRRRYYPLIFISPLPEESRAVLGLELGSNDFLDRPMQQALVTGHYQTSVPFRLIEGYKAYIMFKPVDGSEGIGNQKASQFIVLIVLLADQLVTEIKPLLDDAMSVVVYHNDRVQSDTNGHLYQQLASAGVPPLSTTYQVELEEGRHGYVLSLQRYVQFADVSWSLVGLATVIGCLIYLYSRNFVLKRYNRDLE